VFEFVCSDEEIFRRIRGRALKEGRADDASMEIVETRLAIYRRELPGLLQAYQDRIIRLDSARPAHVVLREILSHL
jgi:adenylate kinase family enzyme